MSIVCLIFLFHLYRDPTLHFVVVKTASDIMLDSQAASNITSGTSLHKVTIGISLGVHMQWLSGTILDLFLHLPINSSMVHCINLM